MLLIYGGGEVPPVLVLAGRDGVLAEWRGYQHLIGLPPPPEEELGPEAGVPHSSSPGKDPGTRGWRRDLGLETGVLLTQKGPGNRGWRTTWDQRLWTAKQTENITFSHPSDAGGNK